MSDEAEQEVDDDAGDVEEKDEQWSGGCAGSGPAIGPDVAPGPEDEAEPQATRKAPNAAEKYRKSPRILRRQVRA
jgi:hypothetical protein